MLPEAHRPFAFGAGASLQSRQMLWLKAFHVVFVVTWFAGLFYLPRLFVYHAATVDTPGLARFIVMERRLYFIMSLGALLAVLFGMAMIAAAPAYLTMGWLRLKLLLVAALNDSDALGEILAAGSAVVGAELDLDVVAPAAEASIVKVDLQTLRFRHPLVRSAIAQSAALEDRRRAHEALATVLADQPDRRAWHRAALRAGEHEDIALDLFKFVAATAGIGRATVPSTGFVAPSAAKADDQVEHLLSLIAREPRSECA